MMMVWTYIRLLRPQQWLKNLLIFFPPFLGGSILEPGILHRAFIPFAAFCLTSSATYIFNDILDAESDIHHPQKKYRPIPSGEVARLTAAIYGLLVLFAALFLGVLNSRYFFLLILLYLAVSASYSLYLKNAPVVDIFCISAGFLLRLYGGGEAFSIEISDWLFLSVLFLSLFLSAGKRVGEQSALGGGAGAHRKSLAHYPDGFLTGVMYLSATVALVTYTMYVIERNAMVFSIPLCAYGLFRYIYRVQIGLGGDPTDSLLRDKSLLAVGSLWVAMVFWGIYI